MRPRANDQPPNLSSPYFQVRVTGAVAGGYAFQEIWKYPDGSDADKIGGRYGDASNPGVSVGGVVLQAGDCALCRSADGAGGLKWELVKQDGVCGTTTTTTTTTASPTTTTTAGPCSGSCVWDFNFTTKTWSKASSTCGTGCKCFAPTFCPSPATGCASTSTACGSFGTDQSPPDCGGATTTPGPGCTTTTAAPGPGCTAGCVWYCHPVRGWLLKTNGCAPTCPCARPAVPCAGACDEASTPCVPLPPPAPPSCGGGCRWVWVTPDNVWSKISDSCSGVSVPNCYCDAPSVAGTVCAQEANTACYVHGISTGSPPCGGTPTTTTGGPTGCAGSCLWGTSDGSAWDTIVRACDGCDCAAPPGAPSSACAQAEGPCQAYPTTTTTTGGPTTTTAAPTTTTTAGPSCTFCKWTCSCPGCALGAGTGTWSLTTNCAPGCTCPGQPLLDCDFKRHGATLAVRCVGPGTTPSPTTTASPTTTTTTTAAPTTTTTTTTTTAAPGDPWYFYTGGTCNGTNGSCVQSSIAPPTCTGPVAGPYATCEACLAANPLATSPCSPP